MKLVIDLGNNFFKAAFFNNGKIVDHISCGKNETARFISFIDRQNFSSVIISSVIRIPDPLFKKLSVQGRLLVFDARCKIPIKSAYKTPVTLGADRIALAVAATEKFPGQDNLVVDAGTCITYDFVNRHGVYLGGAISPGIDMRFKALHKFTGRLPLVKFRPATHEITGDSTQSSILSGVQNGVIFELQNAIDHYCNKYPDINVVISGGHANYLAKMLKNITFAESNFLLFGLYKILLFNE